LEEVRVNSILCFKKGGILITDNALWYGCVAEEEKRDKATEGVRKYNELAFNSQGIISTLLPVRDGVCISLKI